MALSNHWLVRNHPGPWHSLCSRLKLGLDRISSLMFEGDDEGHEEVRSCLSIVGRPIRDDGNGAVAEPSSNLTRACRMLDLVVSQLSQACTVHDPSLGSIWDVGVLGLKKHVHAVFLASSVLSFSLMHDTPSIHCQLQNHVSAKSCHVLAD